MPGPLVNACPPCSMFSAAWWSRCRLVPHAGHACQRTDKPLMTNAPQPEQACEVNPGGTATTRFPAYAALAARMDKNPPPPGIADALGEVVVPDQVGRLHGFVRERVGLTDQRQRGLVVA